MSQRKSAYQHTSPQAVGGSVRPVRWATPIVLVLAITLLTGGGWAGDLYQISTINALLCGVFQGEVTLAELLESGSYGIGTFDSLDGEMVCWEGTIYQVDSRGAVARPPLDWTTPFACVARPSTSVHGTIAGVTSYSELKNCLQPYLNNPNIPYLIRLEGKFASVHTRSVPRQSKPYPPLVEVTRHQPEFDIPASEGVLVGFWCPPFLEGVNVPKFHLHFLSDDRQYGGHLLDCDILEATLTVSPLYHLHLDFPDSEAFQKAGLKDKTTEEILAVEH